MKWIGPVVGLLAGLLLGLALGRSPSLPETRRPAPPSAGVPPTPPAPDVEIETLRRRVEEQARELERLRARPAPAVAGEPAPRPDSRRRAAEIFDSFKRAMASKEGPALIKALGSVDELDASTAAYFVERYREGIEDRELRDMTLMLILLSGGSDAAAFVVESLGNPATPEAERSSLLRSLGGAGLPVNGKLPYDPAIARTAEALLASANPLERMGGAGLLGGSDTDDARVRLARMAERDADAGVRAAAIDSLGWTGDRATLSWLKAFPRPNPDTGVGAALTRALAQLKRRFPD